MSHYSVILYFYGSESNSLIWEYCLALPRCLTGLATPGLPELLGPWAWSKATVTRRSPRTRGSVGFVQFLKAGMHRGNADRCCEAPSIRIVLDELPHL